MMTEEQLKAMEATAPLLVAEVRKLQKDLESYAQALINRDLALGRGRKQWSDLTAAIAKVVSAGMGGG